MCVYSPCIVFVRIFRTLDDTAIYDVPKRFGPKYPHFTAITAISSVYLYTPYNIQWHSPTHVQEYLLQTFVTFLQA